jgi:hypothetical protein
VSGTGTWVVVTNYNGTQPNIGQNMTATTWTQTGDIVFTAGGTQATLAAYAGYSTSAYFDDFTVTRIGTTISSLKEQEQLRLNKATVADNAITVYPNPVTDGWLTVGLNTADVNNKVNVVLSDLSGRIVYKDSFTSNGISQRLNIGTIQPGIYVIRISGTNTKFNSKVTVQ